MIDSNSSSDKDSNVEMTKSKSQFHFNNMRQYVDSIVQSLEFMEMYDILLPVSVNKGTQGVLQFALDNAIHYTRLLKSKLATLPPRTKLKVCRLPDRRKKGSKEEVNFPVPRCPCVRLEGEANFPISIHNTRSKREANSSVSDNKNGLMREANLSISTNSKIIKKPIILTRRRCSNRTNNVTSNIPEVIDISNDDCDLREAATTLLQMKYGPKIDIVLENKESKLPNNVPSGGHFKPPEKSYISQMSSQMRGNFEVIKTSSGTEIINPVHRLRTTQAIELKKTLEPFDQRLRTTQVIQLKTILDSRTQRLRTIPSTELLKPPSLIQPIPKVDANKTPQHFGPIDLNKPELSKVKTFRVAKSKFIEIAEKAFPARKDIPAISWSAFLAMPNPTIKIKNVLFSVKEMDSDVLLLEPISSMVDFAK